MIHRSIKVCGKILLIIALLWHMFAVAVYSIPRDAKDVFAIWTRIDLLPSVTPYMYATSQWQLWNIFAPDPLRRVTTYRILAENGNDWEVLENITPTSYSIFRHSTQMKLLGNLLDDLNPKLGPFAGRFLQLECMDHHVPTGTPIRLTYRSYVLPLPTTVIPGTWWDHWVPTPTDTIGYTITCP